MIGQQQSGDTTATPMKGANQQQQMMMTPMHNQSYPPTPGAPPNSTRKPLPRPLLRQNPSAMDKVIEYFVGDGLNNRYALICANCYSHNGMALKEEFEYLSFICAYCRFFNKARKQRPGAPPLSLYGTPQPQQRQQQQRLPQPQQQQQKSLPTVVEDSAAAAVVKNDEGESSRATSADGDRLRAPSALAHAEQASSAVEEIADGDEETEEGKEEVEEEKEEETSKEESRNSEEEEEEESDVDDIELIEQHHAQQDDDDEDATCQ